MARMGAEAGVVALDVEFILRLHNRPAAAWCWNGAIVVSRAKNLDQTEVMLDCPALAIAPNLVRDNVPGCGGEGCRNQFPTPCFPEELI